MNFDPAENKYTLSTGRKFHSDAGILGLGLEPNGGGDVTDDQFIVSDYDAEDTCDLAGWTDAEKRELAEAATKMWRQFYATTQPNPGSATVLEKHRGEIINAFAALFRGMVSPGYVKQRVMKLLDWLDKIDLGRDKTPR